MKKSNLIKASIACLVVASNAHAFEKDSKYLSLHIDQMSYEIDDNLGSKFNDKNTGFSFGFGQDFKVFEDNDLLVGYDIGAGYVGSSIKNDVSREIHKSDYRITSKVNLGYKIADFAKPYLTAGIGAMNYDATSADGLQSSSGIETSFLYGAGLDFKINDTLKLNLEYQNQEITTNPTSSQTNDWDVDYNFYKVGLKYNF